jgi:uncharacterized protein (DUF1778 family)
MPQSQRISLSLTHDEAAALTELAASYGYDRTNFIRAIVRGDLAVSRVHRPGLEERVEKLESAVDALMVANLNP